MKYEHFRNIVHEAIDRFGVMQIGGEGGEVNHQAATDWLERNYPENQVNADLDARDQLIQLYESQIMDLTLMSKIELGDGVIEEIRRLKTAINE
jgi:hypothetical protein